MRAIWSGSLSFGLINIPVRIYSAAEERALKFHLLDKHGYYPISYLKVRRGTKEEVKYEDIVKGYEYEKGDYVVLTDQDFIKASPRKTKTVDVVSFTAEDEVPSDLIDKPYFIEPDKSAQKAYVLLREALKNAKKVGIAKWILREKERVAMLKPEGKALMLIQLRYLDELRKPEGLNLPTEAQYSKKELDMALMLIGQLQEHFDAADYKDTYTDELKKVIEQKAKGHPIRVKREAEPQATDMRDLMEILRKSLEREREKSAA